MAASRAMTNAACNQTSKGPGQGCPSVPGGLGSASLAGGFVPLDKTAGDAPAVADRDALVLRPGPNVAAAFAVRCSTRGPATLPASNSNLACEVVGLYLNPPENAVVLCVDEKSQCQALGRAQPIRPLRPGIPERQTHDYARHGVTCRFAALNAATGQVTDACYPPHRHQEFLRFLKKTATAYPGTGLHVICDNYATHKHPEVQAWLARNPRVTLHFTPTGCSWINLGDCFFSVITPQALRP